MPMMVRWSRTVAFHKHHGLPGKKASQARLLRLSSQQKKQNGAILGNKDDNITPYECCSSMKFLSLPLYLQLTIENISSAYCGFVLQREPTEGNAWPHNKKGEEASVIRILFFCSRYVSQQTKN